MSKAITVAKPDAKLKNRYITRKTLLYRSGVEGSDFCLNHAEGCSHGCRFPCYAMLIKKRAGRVKDYNDWINPKIVSNSLELLEKEIARYKNKIEHVHLCYSTDPFMYKNPEIKRLSLKIIERLNKENIRCTVLTKGIIPKSLANLNKYSRNNEFGITLISLDPKFKERFEPYTAPYDLRIESLKYFHKKGFKTMICMEPYPTPNFVIQDLSKILSRISFVDKIVFGKMNYNPAVSVKRFPGLNKFYKDCARKVVDFSKINHIDCYIKSETAF